MKTLYQNFRRIALLICLITCVAIAIHAQTPATERAQKEIVTAMNNSAEEWNKGQLETFMGIYDPTATMMFPTGPVGIKEIRELYEKKYFNGTMHKQNLRYGDMVVRLLGKNYALLTGSFTLYGNNLPERSGRYSLVLMHTDNGWKILHDHSG